MPRTIPPPVPHDDMGQSLGRGLFRTRWFIPCYLALAILMSCNEPSETEPSPVPSPNPSPAEAVPPPVWPHPEAPLQAIDLVFPSDFGIHRIAIDPGHGALGNTGNRSVYCRDEQDFTLATATDLAKALQDTGHFEVLLTREDTARTSYRQRVKNIQAWGAEAHLSLHSDSRGQLSTWAPEPGLACWRNDSEAGFSILWSDEGTPVLTERRVTLARAIAQRMKQAGFLAYDGVDYLGLYEGDPVPGVFVDRHRPKQRIFMLRRTKTPTVIIETHHAMHRAEVDRWEQAPTRAVFATAVAAALVDFLSTPHAEKTVP